MHLRRNLIRKAVVVALVTVSLALLATTLLVGPSGAAQRKYTIAFLADPAMTKGTRAAA